MVLADLAIAGEDSVAAIDTIDFPNLIEHRLSLVRGLGLQVFKYEGKLNLSEWIKHGRFRSVAP